MRKAADAMPLASDSGRNVALQRAQSKGRRSAQLRSASSRSGNDRITSTPAVRCAQKRTFAEGGTELVKS